jgi:hypothetical protein
VRLQERDVPSAGLSDASPLVLAGLDRTILGFVSKTLAIAELEVRNLRHDWAELITRAVQPVLWLLLFGEVFARARAIPTGGIPHTAFMAPGILAQSVLFVAIFYGIAIIWERDLGVINKFLVSPTPRAALVLGKAVSAGVRAISQAVIIYILAALLGVKIKWDPLALAGVRGRSARRGVIFDPVVDHRLRREDAGALHGDRPGADDAIVFCEQCDLPHLDDARVAANYFALQPIELRGRRAEGINARKRREQLRAGVGLRGAARNNGDTGYDRGEDVPARGDLAKMSGVITSKKGVLMWIDTLLC